MCLLVGCFGGGGGHGLGAKCTRQKVYVATALLLVLR